MDHIKNLIAKGRLEDAIKELMGVTPEDQQSVVIQLQQRWNTLQEDKIMGKLSYEAITQTQNTITADLLATIKLLTAGKPLLSSSSDSSESTPEGGTKPKIYFSYAWGDAKETGESREKIVNELYDSLTDDGFNIIRDKMNLEYGGLISDFMEDIGEGDLVVVFISDKYVKSHYCMFELYEIARNSKWDRQLFRQRILPVPVEYIAFGDPDVLRIYFTHWKQEEKKWADFILENMQQATEAQTDRYQKTKSINQKFGDLSDWLADINTSTTSLLSQNDFQPVKDAIKKRLDK